MVPFYDHFKKHIQAANETFFKEIREFEQIFDELEAEYEQCVLDNKNLTIEKKNLLIKNDCLIAVCLEKDICSIVLTSDIVVPPSSNCLCDDLRSACDREHTKVLELEAECIDTSSASNAIFEINKLRNQLQGKDDTIRNLETQINITRMLNVGSTEGSCDQQALETDRIQRIPTQYLRNTEKLSALTADNTKLKAQVTGKMSSGPSTSETPKVLAPGMYNLVRMQDSKAHHKTWNKQNRVDSNLLVKHSVSISKLNNVCATCNKSLVFANHNDCLVMCDDSVNVQPHQTKRRKHQPKKEWKPIKKVVQIVLWYLDSGCSRHMTGDRARLINFVEKFIGTVRFGNDEYAAIIGYGDYKLKCYSDSNHVTPQLRYGNLLKVHDNQPVLHLTEYILSASPVCLLTKASSTSHGYGSSFESTGLRDFERNGPKKSIQGFTHAEI
ncbi:hypothetical protein Tco_0894340 [Tanacetum coccineum]|uniref:Retrovirus-related Pol polyprotein from transposon TNT 1-94-like beta-barrel domain-containing protein n=1 Tax=Tanacetum coccineum TaxID=301880 RepID=A0ABQ5CEM3_9ASTR